MLTAFQLAMQHHQNGNLMEAVRHYRQVLQADPANAVAHYNLGSVFLGQGLLADAAQAFRQALRWNPNLAEAHVNLGNILVEQTQPDDACRCYREALRLNPNLADAQYNLGTVLFRQGQPDEAAQSFRQALRLNPGLTEAYYNLGNVLKDAGRHAEAIQSFRQALALNPAYADAHNNLGNALKEDGQLGPAIACFRQALALNPNHAHALNNLGNALVGQGLRVEAAKCLDESLRLDPHNVLAQWSRGVLRLQLGDLAGGWPAFEHRWAVPGVTSRSFPQPRWDGSSLIGKTILVYAEQGLGDTIHFLRYLPFVKRCGGNVLFECQPALFRLLAGIEGSDRLIAAGTRLPPFDVQVPLLSLPGIFGTTLATIPVKVPYLAVNPVLVERWRREMCLLNPPDNTSVAAVGPAFKIGIAWQADPIHPGFHLKSFPLQSFEALARLENVRLMSLQVGPGTADLATASFPVADLGSRFDPHSLEDLAAAVRSLDLVVTVDTAVAHVAAALGVPVWIALPFVACWRWLLDREDSPWYPTVRLFRQQQPGAWHEVFERIATQVDALMHDRA